MIKEKECYIICKNKYLKKYIIYKLIMELSNDTAILCSGGSLKHLNLLEQKKIKYVILINYFWFSSSYGGRSKEPLWKNKYVYNFLKDKEIILWTRDLDGDIKSLFENLNVIKCGSITF